MLLRPIIMSYNNELSLPLLFCDNWIIRYYVFLWYIKNSENNEKIESVWSIYVETDEESELFHNNIDHHISNYETLSQASMTTSS